MPNPALFVLGDKLGAEFADSIDRLLTNQGYSVTGLKISDGQSTEQFVERATQQVKETDDSVGVFAAEDATEMVNMATKVWGIRAAEFTDIKSAVLAWTLNGANIIVFKVKKDNGEYKKAVDVLTSINAFLGKRAYVEAT